MASSRRKLAAVGLVAMVAFAAGCGSDDESEEAGTSAAQNGDSKECVIGFSFGPSDSPTYQEILAFAKPQAEARGCELVEGAPAGDSVKQANEIQTWVQAKQITALVVLPLADNLTPVLKQAKEAGIPIVGYASEQPEGSAAILYNTPALGEQLSSAAIAWAKEQFGDSAEGFSYAMITFDQCGPPCKDRTDAIRTAMEAELGVTPVVEQAGVAPNEGFKLGQTFLEAHPDLNMLLGVGDAVTTGAYKAFQRSDTPEDKLFLGGMDGDQNAIELVAEGGIYRASAALPHSSIGKAVADLPADILENGSAENVVIEPQLVDSPEKAEEYLAAEYPE